MKTDSEPKNIIEKNTQRSDAPAPKNARSRGLLKNPLTEKIAPTHQSAPHVVGVRRNARLKSAKNNPSPAGTLMPRGDGAFFALRSSCFGFTRSRVRFSENSGKRKMLSLRAGTRFNFFPKWRKRNRKRN